MWEFFLSLSAFFVITSFIVLGSNIFLLGRCNSDFWKMSCMILFSLFPWFMIVIALMCAISISTDSSVRFSFVYMALRISLYSFSLCVCSIPKYSLSSFLLLSICFFKFLISFCWLLVTFVRSLATLFISTQSSGLAVSVSSLRKSPNSMVLYISHEVRYLC